MPWNLWLFPLKYQPQDLDHFVKYTVLLKFLIYTSALEPISLYFNYIFLYQSSSLYSELIL